MFRYHDVGFWSIFKRRVYLVATQTTVKHVEASALDHYIKRSEDAWKWMYQYTIYRYFNR
jgi:hypothetical protein